MCCRGGRCGADISSSSGGRTAAWDLLDVPGVGGAWWGGTMQPDAQFSRAAKEAANKALVGDTDLHITYCFLDDDPVEVAERLRRALEKRWADRTIVPLLAAPFYPVAGYEYDRYLP
jgi:hypothetical protein